MPYLSDSHEVDNRINAFTLNENELTIVRHQISSRLDKLTLPNKQGNFLKAICTDDRFLTIQRFLTCANETVLTIADFDLLLENMDEYTDATDDDISFIQSILNDIKKATFSPVLANNTSTSKFPLIILRTMGDAITLAIHQDVYGAHINLVNITFLLQCLALAVYRFSRWMLIGLRRMLLDTNLTKKSLQISKGLVDNIGAIGFSPPYLPYMLYLHIYAGRKDVRPPGTLAPKDEFTRCRHKTDCTVVR